MLWQFTALFQRNECLHQGRQVLAWLDGAYSQKISLVHVQRHKPFGNTLGRL
jgi:hypothetical protein